MHQPLIVEFGHVYGATCCRKIHSACRADRLREQIGKPHIRHQCKIHECQDELCAVGADHEIAGKRQATPAPATEPATEVMTSLSIFNAIGDDNPSRQFFLLMSSFECVYTVFAQI